MGSVDHLHASVMSHSVLTYSRPRVIMEAGGFVAPFPFMGLTGKTRI